ncbi:MAG: hypothetical protein IIU00_06125 [Clostridia bacterium]|nr:hypothetical protein [Clostridia bacterium]
MKLPDVKRVMALRQTVLWNGMAYTVTGCTLKYNRKGGNWYYLLELLDKRTGYSVMTVPMEDVIIAEKSTETAQI